MLVDIPDVGVILGVFASFIGGLVAVTIYNKVKPRLVSESENAKILTERLQYYENLLIDMKIRLDSLEMTPEPQEIPQAQIPKQKVQQETPVIVKEEKPKERIQNMPFGNATDHVLRLITEKPMTSRDIQVTIGRTREHTSRMLKKLFEDGLVERDMSTKPFTYKITEKGLTRIGVVKMVSAQ
ncbi:MAG: winged helix DNA-binding protein [Candidatus Nitrosotalea sp.]|nr:winged helix DNA-binding protein [Candidatus Nitrosotalea sp.]